MFKALGINIAFRLINSLLVAKIEHPEFKQFAEATLGPAKKVAKVLTDKDPDNQAQIQKIWFEENDELVDAAFLPIRAIIKAKVNDPALQEQLFLIADELHGGLAEAVEGPNK